MTMIELQPGQLWMAKANSDWCTIYTMLIVETPEKLRDECLISIALVPDVNKSVMLLRHAWRGIDPWTSWINSNMHLVA